MWFFLGSSKSKCYTSLYVLHAAVSARGVAEWQMQPYAIPEACIARICTIYISNLLPSLNQDWSKQISPWEGAVSIKAMYQHEWFTTNQETERRISARF